MPSPSPPVGPQHPFGVNDGHFICNERAAGFKRIPEAAVLDGHCGMAGVEAAKRIGSVAFEQQLLGVEPFGRFSDPLLCGV